MSFIKVWTDVGDDEFVNLPARITSNNPDGSFDIQYLSVTERRTPDGKKIWSYEDDVYNITDEYITEYMFDECDLHFASIGEDSFIKVDRGSDDEDDSDYEPHSSVGYSTSSEDEDDEEDDGSCGGDDEDD
jgi:hypothetical protein